METVQHVPVGVPHGDNRVEVLHGVGGVDVEAVLHQRFEGIIEVFKVVGAIFKDKRKDVADVDEEDTKG